MSKKTKDKFYANEAFLAKAKSEGRVRRVRLPIAGLKVDYKHYQPRVVHLDMDHVRDLSRILMDDDADGKPADLEPIVAFEMENGDRIPADGHHRIAAYLKAGRDMIPCDLVVGGNKQEAIEFAAACNQRSMLRRTREDARKAACMLFESGWLDRSARVIAEHIGVSSGTVDKWKVEYSRDTGVDLPAATVTKNGRLYARRHRGEPKVHYARNGKAVMWKVSVNGKVVYRQSKEECLAVVERDEKAKAKLRSLGYIVQYLMRRDIAAIAKPSGVLTPAKGGCVGNRAFTTLTASVAEPMEYRRALIMAIGSAQLLMAYFKAGKACIITTHELEGHSEFIETAAVIGVEFMTLDEFVAAVKADEASQAEGRAS